MDVKFSSAKQALEWYWTRINGSQMPCITQSCSSKLEVGSAQSGGFGPTMADECAAAVDLRKALDAMPYFKARFIYEWIDAGGDDEAIAILKERYATMAHHDEGWISYKLYEILKELGRYLRRFDYLKPRPDMPSHFSTAA